MAGGQQEFAIRYREKTKDQIVQRSIPLGTDPKLVQKARELLAEWQVVRDPRRTIDPQLQAIWRMVADLSKMYPSRSMRDAFVNHHVKAGNDIRKLVNAASTWPRVCMVKQLRRTGRRVPKRRRSGMITVASTDVKHT